jgi:hypothetical protein
MMRNTYLDFSQEDNIHYNASSCKDEVSIVGIIVYNNKGSTNLINHFVKIFVFLWDDSENIILIKLHIK